MTGILIALGWLVESVAVGLRALLCGTRFADRMASEVLA